MISDNYYRSIVENSRDAILLTIPDGRIIHVNKATCDLFRMPEDEIYARGRSGLVDGSDPRLKAALLERARTGHARSELSCIRKDGIKFLADCTSTLFKNWHGEDRTAMIIRDISMFQQAEEEMKEAISLLRLDYLTGILVRGAFINMLRQELNRASRELTETSLIIVDIDRFKKVNDSYGHTAGDLVLKEYAKCLTRNLRQYDILGRYGGDEFIACLPNTSLETSVGIAERMRRAIESLRPAYSSEHIMTTASFGVACMDYKKPINIDSFILMADTALYRAKKKRDSVSTILST